jgi:hypothetical protein
MPLSWLARRIPSLGAGNSDEMSAENEEAAAECRNPGPPPLQLPIIGFLHDGSSEARAHLAAAFRQGLSEAGFVDRHNVVIKYRWAQGTQHQGGEAYPFRIPFSIL